MSFDVDAVRSHFPALREEFDGRPAIFCDGPGGTQVPQTVVDAMADYLVRRNANTGGAFVTSRRTDAVVAAAHQAAADLLGAEADELIFGPNMTSLTYALSRSLAREPWFNAEIVVTRLDHDANVSPWLQMAQEMGATVRWVDVDLESCTLDMASLRASLNPNTRLLAVGYASNAVGSINDVATAVGWAREVGALTYVDAVHYAPHGLIDVSALDCDFLVCSAYKFFGPHAGLLFGKRQHLERLRAYQVRPAGTAPPARWETGTQNHEAMAGVTAAVDYLAQLGVTYGDAQPTDPRRRRLIRAWAAIEAHETALKQTMLTGLAEIPGVRIYGLTDPQTLQRRVSTFALRKEGTTPQQVATALAEENIFAWSGNFYAPTLSESLGVEESGGLVRIGLVHYNTVAEVNRCLEVLAAL